MAKNSNQTKTAQTEKAQTEILPGAGTIQTKTDSVDKVLDGLTSVSAKIRYLDSLGWTRGAIAKKVGRRYQHVRNVLVTPVSQPKEQVKA